MELRASSGQTETRLYILFNVLRQKMQVELALEQSSSETLFGVPVPSSPFGTVKPLRHLQCDADSSEKEEQYDQSTVKNRNSEPGSGKSLKREMSRKENIKIKEADQQDDEACIS